MILVRRSGTRKGHGRVTPWHSRRLTRVGRRGRRRTLPTWHHRRCCGERWGRRTSCAQCVGCGLSRSSRQVGSCWPPPPVARLPIRPSNAAGSGGQQVQRLHGDRHRRHRRQVVQRLGLEGSAGGQGGQQQHRVKYVASKAEADYEPNLTAVRQPEVRLHPGGRWPDGRRHHEGRARRTRTSSSASSTRKIAERPTSTRCSSTPPRPAFLAGYLAAGILKTGKVGTYGGLQDPAGDHLHGRLRRRRGALQQGQEQERPGARLGQGRRRTAPSPTTSPTRTRARRSRDALVAQGADIIMPVAGGTGLGTTAAAKAAGGKYAVIWVDVDGCESTQYCSVILTTVVKNIPDAVKEAVAQGAPTARACRPTPGYLGTLANNGVSLAPYHEFDSKVAGRAEGRGRQAEGGHHRRHRQGRVAGPAEVTTATGSSASVSTCTVRPPGRVRPSAGAADPLHRAAPLRHRLAPSLAPGGCAETRTARHHQAVR